MDSNLYFYFVTFLSVLYAVSVRLLQNRIMDKNLMKEVQDKSKRISELTKAAATDRRKAEEMQRLNSELMPMMNRMLIGQMKMMFVLLGVFFAFTWVSGQFDPTLHDDSLINLTQGANGTFSGSFALPQNASASFWYITVNAYENGNALASNQSVFFVGKKTDEIIWIRSTGSPMPVGTDSEVYPAGATVQIHAQAPQGASSATATLNSGTRFYVDLPVTIPLINLRRIYDSQSWFIFAAVIIGLLVSPALSYAEKLKAQLAKNSQ